MEAIVKIGDTLPDFAEGLNAGMWTIGLALTGNEFGMSRQEIEQLPAETFRSRRERAYRRMHQSGAHYVVDSIADVLRCLDDVEQRLSRGERP